MSGDTFLLVYLFGAFVVACFQWVENSRVYHMGGEPSGCLTGLAWPIWAAILIGWLVWRIVKLLRSNPESPA